MPTSTRCLRCIAAILLFLALSASPSDVWAQKTGEPDTRRGALVTSQAGGPDAFGYRWVDSNEPGGPAFDWFDITGVGTSLTLDDDDAVQVTLPFAFPFYGQDKTSLLVASNGYLTFGPNGDEYTNDPIPDTGVPNDVIAPFWEDLNPESGGTIHHYYDASANRFLVQWTDIPHFDNETGGGVYTFQVALYPDGTVRIHYLTMVDGPLDQATIGIENADGSDGLQVAFNTAYVEDNLAVFLTGPWSNLNTDASDAAFIDHVALSWTDAGDEDEYNLYRDGSLIATLDADVVNFNDTGVLQGATPEYCVAAVFQSIEILTSCDTGSLGTLTATDGVLEDRVDLTWPGVSLPGSVITIERDGTPIRALSRSATRFADRTGTPGTLYTYCVIVDQADGTTSAPACDQGERRIFKPTGFTATEGEFDDRILLQWTPRSTFADAYRLYRDPAGSLSFDGAEEYVETINDIDLSGDFTIAFRARRTTTGTTDAVISHGDSPDYAGFQIGFDSANRFFFWFRNDVLTTPATYTDANWHDYIITYEAATRKRSIYVDGILVASDASGQPYIGSGPLFMGRLAWGATNYFAGDLDEVQVRNTVRTAAEVMADQDRLVDTSEPGLAAYWPMDAGTGTTAYEVVGGASGSLTNMDDTNWGVGQPMLLAVQLPEGTSFYVDRAVAPGTVYSYKVAALVTKGQYESVQATAQGFRAFVTPPVQVAATDGQFNDRTRITWMYALDGHDSFKIYRDGGLIHTAGVDDRQYDDTSGSPGTTYSYCVAVIKNSMESVQRCDDGMAGALAPPENVVASSDTFDDRVRITWEDTAGTADGFEVFREGVSIGTTGAGIESYDDRSAEQGVAYDYCVQAFSNADPDNPSVSTQACNFGTRSIVLPPTDVVASDGDFEDMVTIQWANPSTTVMLFKVYRDGVLVDTAPVQQMQVFVDRAVDSDVTYNYCVTSLTIPGVPLSLREEITGVLSTHGDDRLILSNAALEGENLAADRAARAAAQLALVEAEVAKIQSGAALVESVQVCDTGSRSIAAPTQVAASDEEAEDYVQVSWVDNSDVEKGYVIIRSDGLLLNGSGSYVEVADADALDLTNGLTIEAWVRPDAIAGRQRIVSKAGAYSLALTGSRLLFTSWGVKDYTSATMTLAAGTWIHVAAVLDASNDVTFYLNGVQVGSTVSGTAPANQSTEPLMLGQSGSNGEFFAGILKDVRLWNVERSEAAIAALMQERLAGDEAGLTAYWPLDGFSDTTAEDLTGSHDGTLRGNAQLGRRIAEVSASRASYRDYTGTPGTEFAYGVRAFDAFGESLLESDTGIRRIIAPNGFRAADGISETEVALSWVDNSRVESGYEILRDGVVIGTTARNVTSYLDTAITIGQTYMYGVRAIDAYGSSELADNEGSTTILPATSMSASTTYDNRIVIAWVDNSGVNIGYRLYRDGAEMAVLVGAGATTYTDNSASVGVTYQYCVEAITNEGNTSEQVCTTGRRMAPVVAVDGVIPEVFLEGPLESSGALGASVSVDGEWAVAGAPLTDDLNTGAAIFFQRIGGAKWEQRSLVTPTSEQNAFAGSAVAISGGYAIVGAEFDKGEGSTAAINTGAAYIYELKGSTWEQVQKLTDPSGTNQDFFGRAVSIDGDWALVGAPFANSDVGRVFFYKRNGSGTWDLITTKNYPSSNPGTANFGNTVSLKSDWAIIGAPGADTFVPEGGAAAFYKRDGNSWNYIIGFGHTNQAGAQFGFSVSMGNDWAAIGSPGTTDCAAAAIEDDRGVLQQVVSQLDTSLMTLPELLTESDFTVSRVVGNGSTEPGSTTSHTSLGVAAATDCGAFYIFRRSSDNSWAENFSFLGSEAFERQGTSVAIEGNYAAAGSGAEAVTAFVYKDGWGVADPSTYIGYDPQGSFSTNPRGLAMSNDWIMVGAQDEENEIGALAGAAYLTAILPEPKGTAASDGTFEDRIQVKWEDLSGVEGGFRVLRRNEEGTLEVIGTTDPDTEVFDDFSAEPGGSYEYCVVAFLGEKDSVMSCDDGWRPKNGALSGRIASLGGGGTRDVEVCLLPSPNKGLVFDGVSGHVRADNLRFGESNNLDAFTVEMWVNVESARNGHPFSYATINSTNELLVANPANLEFYVDGTSTGASGVSVNDGQWHHLAFTWDNTSGLVRLYKDGVLAYTSNAIEVGHVVQPGGVLILGQDQDAIGGGFDEAQAYLGELDEVRLWSTARSETDIAAMRAEPLVGDELGLVGYWALDQGARAVAPDVTVNANHGRLVIGTYWTDSGAPLDICGITDADGNYAISNLRYGLSTQFSVNPFQEGRTFSPAAKPITLSTENPVQNEVDFVDETAFTVTGIVQFKGTTCPVPGAEMFVTEVRNGTEEDRELKIQTESDGTYRFSVDPSRDDRDLRRIEPVLGAPGEEHKFSPEFVDLEVTSDQFDINFENTELQVLTGYFGGSCSNAGDIGTAVVRLFTEDGCFDQELTIQTGTFELRLPPQAYLIEVKTVETDHPLRADMVEFFQNLGAQEIDLSGGDQHVDLIYSAPLSVTLNGLPTASAACDVSGGIAEIDEDGNVLRTLPNVPILMPAEEQDLEFLVEEDYLTGKCPVNNGSLTVFDTISDRSDPVVLTIEDGVAVNEETPTGTYTLVAGTPNTFAGARVDGVDRSYQKSITYAAEVTGRPPLVQTDWALVNGRRARTATFVSATTDPIPMLILHDPPGSNSYAYIEEGATTCSRISNVSLVDFGIGPNADVALGLNTGVGLGFNIENGIGALFQARTMIGGSTSGLSSGACVNDFGLGFGLGDAAVGGITNAGTISTKGVLTLMGVAALGGLAVAAATTLGPLGAPLFYAPFAFVKDCDGSPLDANIEVCMTTTERWSTPGDPTWVGEDLYAGAALNLIFAQVDELLADGDACEVSLTEIIGMDLDPEDAFETTYVYGGSHIEYSLIPALESLQADQEFGTGENAVTAAEAIANWKDQLDLAGQLTEIGVGDLECIQKDAQGAPVLDDNNAVIPIECPSDFKPPFVKTNRSFSSGADYEFSYTTEETRPLIAEVSRFYIDNETNVGAVKTIGGYDQNGGIAFTIQREWVSEKDSTQASTRTVGYVLSDGDTGDYFSVDVGTDPAFLTPVFSTVSGRSSNPLEDNTQPRDSVLLSINPPVQLGVPADETASFTLSITNASPSSERRQYTIAVPGETNLDNAVITTTGDILGGERLETFLIEPGQTKSVNIGVLRGPDAYQYDDMAVIAYPELEYDIWKADTRQPFAMADTAWFSVHFTAPCSDINLLQPQDLWVLNEANPTLDVILNDFDVEVSEIDRVTTVGFQYRLAGDGDRFGNSWLPGGSILVDDLNGLDSWSTTWTPAQDGDYEIRAFTECEVAGPGGRVFSENLYGVVDTEPPVVFGTPEPADQVLSLGTDIAIDFNEPMDCNTVITNGNGTNATITYLDGPDQGTTIAGVQAVCDGRTLYLSPPSTFDWSMAENRLLEAFIDGGPQGPADLAGNLLADDVTWAFTVRRSAFTWRPVNRVVDVQVTTEKTFSADLVNGRAQPADYTITSVPDWLTISSTAGTLPAGGETTISFTLPDTLSLGTRVDTLRAETDQGDALFFLTVNIQPDVCEPPVWTPMSGEFTMTVTGQLFFEGVVSDDVNDFVAAVVGNQIRGVANVQDVQAGSNRVNLLVSSNVPSGETVTFRAFDASSCTEYPSANQSLVFVGGDAVGTQEQPQAINASFEAPQQEIALAAGWTWFSLNRMPASGAVRDVLSTVGAQTGDVVKSQTAFSLFDGAAGWVGALLNVAPGRSYQVRLTNPASLIVAGPPVDPATTPIAINEGWNWIGYLPQASQSVDAALASLTPTQNDLVKSQYQFAQWDGSNWVGSLTQMDPGLGYQLNSASADVLTYTEPSAPAALAMQEVPGSGYAGEVTSRTSRALHEEAESAPAKMVRSQPARAEVEGDELMHASVHALAGRYPYTMTLTAIATLDGEVLTDPNTVVTALVADEVRGTGRVQYVESLDAYRVFVMVYGLEADGEEVALEVYDPSLEQAFTLDAVAFEAEAMQGTPLHPVRLDAMTEAYRAALAAAEMPTTYALEQNYPNPFNPETAIRYALPEASEVSLIVYDVLGREVMRLIDGTQQAGWHTVSFDGRSLASGMYLYRLEAGAFKQVQTMMLVK